MSPRVRQYLENGLGRQQGCAVLRLRLKIASDLVLIKSSCGLQAGSLEPSRFELEGQRLAGLQAEPELVLVALGSTRFPSLCSGLYFEIHGILWAVTTPCFFL